MKRALQVIIFLPLIVLIVFFALGLYSQTGTPIGLKDGKLAPCPDRPNCVSSESSPSDQHSVAAIELSPALRQETLQKIRTVIESMGGEVLLARDNYLSSTFTSELLQFVDDVEFRVDSGSALIHIRSGSRVGYSDFNVNRERVDAIREALNQL